MTVDEDSGFDITHFTIEEGGSWIPFNKGGLHLDIINASAPIGPRGLPKGIVHAIKFQNGLVWDVVNGWRPVKENAT